MKFFATFHTLLVAIVLVLGIAAVVTFTSSVFCKMAGILK